MLFELQSRLLSGLYSCERYKAPHSCSHVLAPLPFFYKDGLGIK